MYDQVSHPLKGEIASGEGTGCEGAFGGGVGSTTLSVQNPHESLQLSFIKASKVEFLHSPTSDQYAQFISLS